MTGGSSFLATTSPNGSYQSILGVNAVFNMFTPPLHSNRLSAAYSKHAPLLSISDDLSLLIDKKHGGGCSFILTVWHIRISIQGLGCHTSEHDIAVLWSLFQLVFERVEPSVGWLCSAPEWLHAASHGRRQSVKGDTAATGPAKKSGTQVALYTRRSGY